MKALSPVVATILLIGITVAAAVGVWMLTQRTSSVGSTVKVDVISSTAVAPPDGSEVSITVLVRNSGNTLVTGVNVNASIGATTITLTPPNANIPPGATVEFTGSTQKASPGTYKDGDAVKITVQYKAPDGTTRTIVDYVTVKTTSY